MYSLSLRRASRAALLMPLAVLAACDLPSEAPIFEQTWVVPADSVSVGVGNLLPSGVAVNGGGTAFVVTTPAANINTSLGAVCGQAACQSGVTVNAPVPAFTSSVGAFSSSIAFPVGVNSASVAGGTIAILITNNLGFDPLRPNGAAAPYGRLIVTVTSGTTARTDTIQGSASQGIANSASTNFSVTLPIGSYANTVSVAMSLVVPAGGNANLNAGNAISVNAMLQNLAVSQATVVVSNRAISTAPSEFDLDGLDFDDEVQSGAIILDIANPFTAAGSLNVVINAPMQGGSPAVNIQKTIAISAQPNSSQTVALTRAELVSLLGKSGVTVSTNGTVTGTGAGNTVTVTPTSQITVRTQMQLILHVGA
ncbi:MAG: hypothetical protein ACKVS7_11435 [Gemmatimonadaceae bacterium]